MDKVAVVACADYRDAEAAVRSALDLLGMTSAFRGKRVLLKVNLMKGAAPHLALNTHPEFVRAVVRVVHAQGGRAIVADSSGILGLTAEAFRAAGIAAVVAEEGAELLDLDTCRPVRREVAGRILREVWVPEVLDQVDVLVTVPKLKTHTLTGMTCALKNQVGILPGGFKCHIHEVAPTPPRLAHAILDLNQAVRFSLAIVDGILGLAGQGKFAPPTPTRLGAVVAGDNLVSTDAVCAHLIGLRPEAVLTTRYGAERGMGQCDLTGIETVGDAPERLRTAFLPPGFEPKRWRLFARLFYHVRGRSVRPVVRRELCTRCGECAAVCPTGALVLSPYPRISGACIFCFACRARCRTGALQLRCRWLLRRSFRKRAAGLDISQIA